MKFLTPEAYVQSVSFKFKPLFYNVNISNNMSISKVRINITET